MKYLMIDNNNYELLKSFRYYAPVLLDEIKNKEKIGFAVIQDNIIIGCLLIQFKNKRDSTFNSFRVYLQAFVVEAEYQNKGIGTGLFLYAMQELKKLGYKEVSLGISDDNNGAKRFYSRFGFKYIFRDTEYIDNNFDVFIANIEEILSKDNKVSCERDASQEKINDKIDNYQNK